jgi:hypothetical protein
MLVEVGRSNDLRRLLDLGSTADIRPVGVELDTSEGEWGDGEESDCRLFTRVHNFLVQLLRRPCGSVKETLRCCFNYRTYGSLASSGSSPIGSLQLLQYTIHEVHTLLGLGRDVIHRIIAVVAVYDPRGAYVAVHDPRGVYVARLRAECKT